MNYEINVQLINSDNPKAPRARASVTLDNAIIINGFTIWNGDYGLRVTGPQIPYTDKDGSKKNQNILWYKDAVTPEGKKYPVSQTENDLSAQILAQYERVLTLNNRQSAATANHTSAVTTNTKPKINNTKTTIVVDPDLTIDW